MVRYLSKFLADFKRDERGAFSVFLVGMFTTLILVGGAAIDLVRFEAVRSSIQFSLDRAVLAAASMRQVENPGLVVADYMSKVDTLSSFNVTMGEDTNVTLTGRRVSATATATLSTYFLRIIGIDTMDVTAVSKATEEIPNLEISLVLDISGSMGWDGVDGSPKIDSLKAAANTFVDTVIIPDDNSQTTISIIPYAYNVSVPQSMWDLYNTEGLTTQTRCMIFEDDDYNSAAISTVDIQRQLPFVAKYGGFDPDFDPNDPDASSLNFNRCSVDSYAEIMPYSTSVADLQAKINSLQAAGSTASHIGTKWGVALLDPAAADIGANIGGDVANIPAEYQEPGVLKVMVVMTDGDNRDHYDLYNNYRSGPSDMYTVLEDDETNYYIYRPDNARYYKVNDGTSQGSYSSTLPGSPVALEGEDGYRVQFAWPQVWERISTKGYAKTIGKNWYNYENKYSPASEADTEMNNSCSIAKNRGVLVYTIAFSAPSAAQTLLQGCATSINNYYDVDNTDIASAFAAIAVSIQKLKLTQ
jgi:Flp pilus assembly protein TadG